MFDLKLRLLPLFMAFAIGPWIAGCALDDDDYGYRDDDYGYRDDRVGYPLDRDRDWRERDLGIDYRDPPDREALRGGVPERARLVRDAGRGQDLSYRAPHPGTLYLFDATEGRVIFDAPLRDGDLFRLDGDSHRALVNNREVFDRGIRRDHRYDLYFIVEGL